MEVTATALLCLNTSSRLSCRENRNSITNAAGIQKKEHTWAGAAHLRLGEHVQAPGAHLPIGGDADQVVSVLSSHHVHAVDGMLRAKTRCKLVVFYKNWKWNEKVLLCVQQQTEEFSEQECACCSCCPTGRSGRSKSRPPPGWGET